MTPLLAYLGPPVRLASILVDHARSPIRPGVPGRGPMGVGGFGVGWYVPDVSPHPAVVRLASAPWHDANLRNVAAVSCSPCVVAHARGASEGMPASEANCHPFRHGRVLFAHSGRVGGFRRVRRAFLESLSDEAFSMMAGTTDSEVVFGLYLDLLWARQEVDAHLRLAASLNEMAWRIVATLQDRAPGAGVKLNVALSDGDNVVACRFSWNEEKLPDPLHYITRQVFDPIRPPPPARRARERSIATTISSDRLTDDPDWVTIPPGHLVIADREVEPLHFEMRPRGLVPASR